MTKDSSYVNTSVFNSYLTHFTPLVSSYTLRGFLIPLDTRRNLNVHKMFRRRRRRFLNVFCTFNLRVSRMFSGCVERDQWHEIDERKITSELSQTQIFEANSYLAQINTLQPEPFVLTRFNLNGLHSTHPIFTFI